MTASLKMLQLESKISELQHQYSTLLKEREEEITALISLADLAHLDDKTLLGGLLFIKDKITIKGPITEAWHDAGEKFLRQTKVRTSSHQQTQRGRKEPCTKQQPSVKRDIPGKPSKPTYSPQPTDQSAQEYPQEGEA